MSLGINRDWLPLTALDELGGQLGVFELADASERLCFVGIADARQRFGLRGAVQAACDQHHEARMFRVEVTSAYTTRYQELLMWHEARSGLPAGQPRPVCLGRLSPA